MIKLGEDKDYKKYMGLTLNELEEKINTIYFKEDNKNLDFNAVRRAIEEKGKRIVQTKKEGRVRIILLKRNYPL